MTNYFVAIFEPEEEIAIERNSNHTVKFFIVDEDLQKLKSLHKQGFQVYLESVGYNYGTVDECVQQVTSAPFLQEFYLPNFSEFVPFSLSVYGTTTLSGREIDPDELINPATFYYEMIIKPSATKDQKICDLHVAMVFKIGNPKTSLPYVSQLPAVLDLKLENAKLAAVFEYYSRKTARLDLEKAAAIERGEKCQAKICGLLELISGKQYDEQLSAAISAKNSDQAKIDQLIALFAKADSK